jgi:hypothetical protein
LRKYIHNPKEFVFPGDARITPNFGIFERSGLCRIGIEYYENLSPEEIMDELFGPCMDHIVLM